MFSFQKPLILLHVFFLVWLGEPLWAKNAPKVMLITGIQNEQTHAVAREVLKKAYGKIGYAVRFTLLPGQRSINMVNNGESDGDIARIVNTQKTFTNLVPVPTPIIQFAGVAFTKTIDKKINRWEDLKGLKIGIIRGIRYSEIGTQGLSPYFAEDMTHLFKLLNKDMIQIGIAVLRAGQIELSQNFRNCSIHRIGGILYSGQLYHYIHKKNQAVLPELNNALQQMKHQGEIQRIIDAEYNRLLGPKEYGYQTKTMTNFY